LHSTLFIKNNADFNERLATFLAQVGTEMYYKKLEGESSETLKFIEESNQDDNLFSQFITNELEDLKKWYKDTPNINDEMKTNRLKQIQVRFKNNLFLKMKTQRYEKFVEIKLNNARLLPYLTYLSDLSDFEKAHIKLGADFHKTLAFLKNLESSKKPSEDLKKFIN